MIVFIKGKMAFKKTLDDLPFNCAMFWGIFCLVSVLCLMPALLLYFLGYVPRHDWNENAVLGLCNVTQHDVIAATCSRKYNQKIHYTCYQGYPCNHQRVLNCFFAGTSLWS